MAGKSALSPAIHNITFCGLTGAIFTLLASAVVLCTISFVTHSWWVDDGAAHHFGLWQKICYISWDNIPAWFMASRVILTVGFGGVILSCVLTVLYMTANRASKNDTLTSLAFISFITVVLLVIGVAVIGFSKADSDKLSWSYGLTIAGAILTFVAGVLTIIQIRRSNVHPF